MDEAELDQPYPIRSAVENAIFELAHVIDDGDVWVRSGSVWCRNSLDCCPQMSIQIDRVYELVAQTGLDWNLRRSTQMWSAELILITDGNAD
jgi:hypothetical protein